MTRRLRKRFGGTLSVQTEDRIIRVTGQLSSWEDIVAACAMCVSKAPGTHVVNDVVLTGAEMPEMRVPALRDKALDGERPDVLIIGGGISGASIARELTRWQMDVLLVDKEADLAMHASGRNDGEVHPGVDLNKGSLKQRYVRRGNQMFDTVCSELDVPFDRCGQYVGFTDRALYPIIWAYAWQRRHVCGVTDTRLMGQRELREREPHLNPDFKFAMYNPSAGCVCPYGLTIAYGENAVENGARISLNTAVLGMKLENDAIAAVETNRGTLYPRLVINAAGAFAEDIARMAGDRFYSIHPRRGTNSILDKKAGGLLSGIASIKTLAKNAAHTKGGGILHTVHGNLLVGPNAVETWEKENFATGQDAIDAVFDKQKLTAAGLRQQDIITYFTGVRPATFEEDFILEPGRRTKNLIHCAGIQSPGLTTAPAVAVDIAKMAVGMLGQTRKVAPNRAFNPRRKGIPVLRDLPREERHRMIQENPDYGVIVCRCEEISKGEILDALRSPLPVPTVDGVKKRVRPGMGRCQGGFCMPLVTQIISEATGVPVEDVRKAGKGAVISYGKTKE
nr:NAD(P)/FAD-dependent oxidoreductase [Eubacterium sp. 1001713B170207_170306_E7]